MTGRGFQKNSGDEILSEINVIPLVDISLVLLIIFMVTANYIMTSSFVVDIPRAQHAKEVQPQDAAVIGISSDGPVYLEDKVVTTAELKKKMKAKFRDNPDIAVILSVDRSVNFKNVVAILDLLSELGISRLNIAATND